MSWLTRFRNLFRRDAVSDEIDRELAFHLAERADDLEAAGVSAWRTISTTIEAPRGTLRYEVISLVSGNGFELFGLQPRLGRLLTRDDDVPGGPAHGWLVVLSHTLWRDRFGADPGVIGGTIKIRDDVLTVVGVTRASFHGVVPGFEPAIYLPLHYTTRLNGGDALRLVALGAGVGGIALIFSVRSIESMLYGVGAFDLATFAAAALLLLAVVLFATAWPARRAASIDPIEAMRID